MSQITIGLPENSRNSSRGTNASGGQHTDIFGRDVEPAGAPNKTSRPVNNIITEDTTDEAKNESPKKTDDKSKENKTETVVTNTPQRVRVPPGGFSSGGFW